MQAMQPNRIVQSDSSKESVHAMISLNAPDQLLQRIAFALSQIFVVGETLSVDGEQFMAERYLAYYDIFTRHAAGNYLDVMRETSYSPVMGEWLSSVESKSVSYSGSKPDESAPVAARTPAALCFA